MGDSGSKLVKANHALQAAIDAVSEMRDFDQRVPLR